MPRTSKGQRKTAKPRGPENPPLDFPVKLDRETKTANRKCVGLSALPLQPHQRKSVEFLNTHRGEILVHAPGSGKTLTAVASAACFLSSSPKNTVVLVAPASLVGNFHKEMAAFGMSDEMARRITTMSYNQFSKSSVICSANTMLILDEAHNRRTGSSRMTVDTLRCACGAKKVLLLTATPIVNGIQDLFTLAQFVNPTLEFPRQTGAAAVAMVQKILEPANFRRLFGGMFSIYAPSSRTTITDYPSSKTHEVFLRMSPSYEAKYNLIEANKIKKASKFDIFSESKNLTAFYNGIRRASNAIDGPNSPKLTWLRKFLVAAGHQSGIVFSNFKDAGINTVKALLRMMKISFVHLDGSVGRSQRQKIVNLYNDKTYQVLLITRAGAEGLDLKDSRYIILMEPHWNETQAVQVIGRAIRYKSHAASRVKHVDIYRLYLLRAGEDKSQAFRRDQDPKPSADLYLRKFSSSKQQLNDIIMRRLDGVNILHS